MLYLTRSKMKILKNKPVEGCQFSFVLFEQEDCRALSLAELECFENDPWSENAFRESFGNPACKVFGFYNIQLSKIIAYSVWYICEDESDLANIAVLPEFRGQGIGGALLLKCLEKAREYGVLRTFLEVRSSNAPAKALYLSKGFAEIGIRRNYYRSPREDAVLMMRSEEETERQ